MKFSGRNVEVIERSLRWTMVLSPSHDSIIVLAVADKYGPVVSEKSGSQRGGELLTQPALRLVRACGVNSCWGESPVPRFHRLGRRSKGLAQDAQFFESFL